MAAVLLPNQCSKKRESMRERTWRNMMVLAINEGIQRNIISLQSNDIYLQNFNEPHVYKFLIDSNIEAITCIKNAGFNELAIRVAFWPTKRAEEVIKSYNGWFRAGDAYARGWLLYRSEKTMLQGFDNGVCCRKHLIQLLLDMQARMKTEGHGQDICNGRPVSWYCVIRFSSLHLRTK